MSKSNKAREKRLKEITKESQYKTPSSNPEVFNDGNAFVTSVDEHEDGSATIQLEFTREQRDMLFDVCLRQAVVNGLKKIDEDSEEFSESLGARNQVIDQARVVLEWITHWETDCDLDWEPSVAVEVQKLRELIAKL